MKSLTTLIRLKKTQLDELRRKLVALETQKDQQVRRSASLDEELRHEMDLAKTQTEMSGFFGNFANRIKLRQLEIAKEVARLDKLIGDAGAQVHEAFSELKKLDVVKARRMAEKEAHERQQEMAQINEVALQQHVRKKKK